MSPATTPAPSRAKSKATARPIPLPAPVTRATLPLSLSAIVRSLSVSLLSWIAGHVWTHKAGNILCFMHLSNHIPWYRRRETLRDGTHNSRIKFGFAFCCQQAVCFLPRVSELRIAETSNCGAIEDSLKEFAVLGEEGVLIDDCPISKPGVCRGWLIADAPELRQQKWLVFVELSGEDERTVRRLMYSSTFLLHNIPLFTLY